MPSLITPRECIENCPSEGGINLSAVTFVAIAACFISLCVITLRLRRVAARNKLEKRQKFTKALRLSPSTPYSEPAPPYEPTSPMPPTPAPLLKFPPPSYSPA